ncbi:MAG: hypothetical protein HY040_16070 [Planctomycetes bacterium]|nr:hypothetical protein [Planctomycetota bacterium]
MDRVKEILLDALRLGADVEGEQRLYQSGKLPGLFTGRTSLHAEIASQAVRDGLIEIIRTESKGKTTTEWVKVTAKGIEYLLAQESPIRAMEELKAVLQLNQDGIPAWLMELRRSVDALSQRLANEVEALNRRMESLTERVVEALKRAEKMGPALPEGAAGALPWGHEAVSYLERRRDGGLGEKCALPELFAVLKDKENGLVLRDFHLGLRRLHDRGVLRLLPFDGPEGPPEPEYALLDGPQVFYYAAR